MRGEPWAAWLCRVGIALCCAPAVVYADGDAPLDLPLEELLDVRVTIATRQPHEVRTSPSAVTIISREQIRNSGMTSLAELMRLVPGMQVAQVNGHRWAITARGFNAFFASKLLVMIDGRSVYDPRFAGVYWDVQDLPLVDVERIEVIRGPGGSVWGANAVNGVINIVTRSAADTEGSVVEVGGGSRERAHTVVRHGAALSDETALRVFAKYRLQRDFRDPNGDLAHDGWDQWRGGFRLDWSNGRGDAAMAQGTVYRAFIDDSVLLLRDLFEGPRVFDTTTLAEGGHLLARWTRERDRHNVMVQTYYNRAERDWAAVGAEIDTLDVDTSGGVEPQPWLTLSGGAGYRWIRDESFPGGARFTPRVRRDHYIHGFAQAQARAWSDRLEITTGTKVEHNDYSGLEVQPTFRAVVEAHEHLVFWGGVSRAVRPPSRVEHDMRADQTYIPPSNTVMVFLGDERVDAEVVLAHELGVRAQASQRVLTQLSGFYNRYTGLVGVRVESDRGFMEAEPAPPHFVLPLVADNLIDGRGMGIEVEVDAKLAPWMSLRGTYSFIDLDLDEAAPGEIPNDKEGKSASHVGSLEAHVAPRSDLRLSLLAFGASKLEFDNTDQFRDATPAYLRLDLLLAYTLRPELTLTLAGRNLLEDRHNEFLSGASIIATDVPRTFFAKATASF